MNRYGYADANPVTAWDPDGHCPMTSTGWGGCSADAGPNSYAVTQAVGAYGDSLRPLVVVTPPRPVPSVASATGLDEGAALDDYTARRNQIGALLAQAGDGLLAGASFAAEFSGAPDVVRCGRSDAGSCGMMAAGFIPFGKAGKMLRRLPKFGRHADDAADTGRLVEGDRAVKREVGAADEIGVADDIETVDEIGTVEEIARADELGVADEVAAAAAIGSPATNGGSATFYTVQSADDAARLAAGGTPWPTSATRAEFGPGIYAWGNADDASSYAAVLESRGACVQVCEFSIDTSNLRHVDVESLADPAAFMSKYSQLWGGTPSHGLDYITRGTQFGTQHYFSPNAFGSATWMGPR